MKKGSLLDRIATWGVRLALPIVGNQAVYPEVLNHWAESWQTRGVSKIAPENIYIQGLEEKINLDARNYLDLANSIIHQSTEKGAVCRDYVKPTLKVYKELIEKADKKDLINCIRSVYDGEHNWLEIIEGGKWRKYETMHKTPILTKDIVRDYSDSTEKQREYLNGNPNRKAQIVCHSSNVGTNCHPTLDAYFEKGGNLVLLTRAFSGN